MNKEIRLDLSDVKRLPTNEKEPIFKVKCSQCGNDLPVLARFYYGISLYIEQCDCGAWNELDTKDIVIEYNAVIKNVESIVCYNRLSV